MGADVAVTESTTLKDKIYLWLRIFLCGICMGTADIIPGISGGTIAFIMGFYTELLESIKSIDGQAFAYFFRLRFKACFHRINGRFLFPLGLGIAFAFISLAQVMQFLLGHESYRVLLYAAFLGLITASILLCAKQVQRWRLTHFIALFIGAFSAYLLTGSTLIEMREQIVYEVPVSLPIDGREAINYRDGMLLDVPESTLEAMIAKNIISEKTIVYQKQGQQSGAAKSFIPQKTISWIDWSIMGCGGLAVSAMLLPGISGSYLLTILGVYSVAIGAIADLSTGLQQGRVDHAALLFLVNMGIGIVVGALLFSRVITFLFRRYEQITLVLMIGIMIGALRSVWPFWNYLYFLDPLHLEKGPLLQIHEPLVPDLASPFFYLALALMIVGFFLVWGIEKKSSQRQQRQAENKKQEF